MPIRVGPPPISMVLQKNPELTLTLPPSNMASAGGRLEDEFALEGARVTCRVCGMSTGFFSSRCSREHGLSVDVRDGCGSIVYQASEEPVAWV